MIYELRTYTLFPGKMPDYLKAAETIGRPARGDNYGRCHAYWTSEFGQLNQIWHLWSYDSLNERERLRGELQKNEKWTKEYVPTIRPLIARQDLRVLNGVVHPAAPTTGSHLYELRMYRTVLGGARQYAENLKAVLPVRGKYSPAVGVWTGEFPQPNELLHMWRYKDLNERAAARAAVMKEPAWQEYLKKGAPLLAEMQSIILMPTVFSPMK
ncbi:MAG: NIPSNAP family protein [Alphaproteobacteria bacterium]|nr:NIPSNAP family protein [Alphaproteobacteria bacterium]